MVSCINNNSYCAHHENVLFSMPTDEDEGVRKRAAKITNDLKAKREKAKGVCLLPVRRKACKGRAIQDKVGRKTASQGKVNQGEISRSQSG